MEDTAATFADGTALLAVDQNQEKSTRKLQTASYTIGNWIRKLTSELLLKTNMLEQGLFLLNSLFLQSDLPLDLFPACLLYLTLSASLFSICTGIYTSFE